MNRIIIAGEDELAFGAAHRTLTEQGYDVVNDPGTSLRVNIGLLSTADDICLLDDWWTSRDAVALQTIAAWLRLGVVDPTGVRFETTSLRG